MKNFRMPVGSLKKINFSLNRFGSNKIEIKADANASNTSSNI